MKVFDSSDKKKLLFGPLSWPTELPAIWFCVQNKPLNDSWVTVIGGDAEFIRELIASGLLAGAEAPKFWHSRTRKMSWILRACTVQNSKAQFEEHIEMVRARDAAPSQDEEDREPVRRPLEADAMWKSHLRSDQWPRLGPP